MIYTEEDLKQAYDMGYNEAVDDVNEYIDQESMEFSLDESYDEDYSAVEDMVCNEKTEYGSPEWMKRHELSNMRRTAEKKFGLSNNDVYTRRNFTTQQLKRFKDAHNDSRWGKEGRRDAAERYNKAHAKKGDLDKHHYNLD